MNMYSSNTKHCVVCTPNMAPDSLPDSWKLGETSSNKFNIEKSRLLILPRNPISGFHKYFCNLLSHDPQLTRSVAPGLIVAGEDPPMAAHHKSHMKLKNE